MDEPTVESAPAQGLTLEFGKCCICSFFGRMGAGKSQMIKSLTYQASKCGVYSWILVMCPTKFNNDYDYLPDEAVVAFSPDKFLKVFEDIGRYRSQCQAKGKKADLRRGLIVLDDTVGSNQKLMYRPAFVNAFVTCRHFGPIDLWTTAQYYTGVPPVVRSLTNYCFVWRTQGQGQLKGMYTFAGGMCENYKHFRQLLNDTTKKPYSCLVYRSNQPDFESSYISFSPEMAPNFKLNYKLPFKIS